MKVLPSHLKALAILCVLLLLRQVDGFLAVVTKYTSSTEIGTCTANLKSRSHTTKHGGVLMSSAASSSADKTNIAYSIVNDGDDGEDYDDLLLARLYLKRIGFSDEEIASILHKEEMTTLDLQGLVSGHLLNVPFENLDLMTHPSGEFTGVESLTTVSLIERKAESDLPSLDVKRSLHKIVHRNRGGFCYEVNLSFCWLLHQIGFKARLALSDVSCKQEHPAHVVILVDGLMDIPILVDVGFGCPGVCDVILPLEYDTIYSDLHGDEFSFIPQASRLDDYPLHEGRFDTILYRRRVDSPDEILPMYRFHSEDDLDNDALEFQRGLQYVLTTSTTFNEKRLCVISTERGHITLGSDYVKWVERWETVTEKHLPTEDDWRAALLNYFGVRLE